MAGLRPIGVKIGRRAATLHPFRHGGRGPAINALQCLHRQKSWMVRLRAPATPVPPTCYFNARLALTPVGPSPGVTRRVRRVAPGDSVTSVPTLSGGASANAEAPGQKSASTG